MDFTPVDLMTNRTEPAPGGSRRVQAADPFAEEPRTAGNYKIRGEKFWVKEEAGPSFAQSLHESAPAAPPSGAPGFADFLDMINPLQHIPLINIAYRQLTGDQIGGAAQLVGGALFGGPLGAVAGAANAIAQHQTGRSLAGATVAALNGESLENPHKKPADITLEAAGPVKRYNFNLKSA